MPGVKIDGKPFDTTVKILDLYNARRAGCDVGDLTNGKLQALAVNLLDALDAAFYTYAKRLAEIGIEDLDTFLSIDAATLQTIADQYREELTVFFPVLEAIQTELAKAIQEAVNEVSGQTSSQPPES